MDGWLNVDWGRVILPSISPLELIVRGSIAYLALFAILRIVHKRQAGAVAISDLLVVVLIADAIQNGMSGEYISLIDGIILVTTIVLWSYALDWIGFKFPAFQRLIQPPPLSLIAEGRVIHRNLRRELISMDELMTAIRKNGIDSIEEVKNAYMENDGHISVVPQESVSNHPDMP